ncbi:cell division protein FtsY [Corynebacterium falsenii DSM 44353]|uniref:signal recognition particle-docking protein FtsY n=1 Tax=Corynebacterium falsenii TaxID=108486 RepID=UPI0003E964B0|nr:signal recognition particle-docking protein FtsY [Corynebacterium falsenii]AHI03340.1 cell division protein FtsY [Corynebacterium falsenii DSM 44353]MDC7103330.1 signal recognition particle-docking protein FtsY [Corynebacterium falsenii]UBI04027.1 signal recognition particle-docking protein FtsY [Corynebacterium falsenii]
MNSTVLWIIIGVVVLVIIAAIIIAVGLKRSKAKQISFEKKDELEQKKPSSGDYQAQGGFNFTAGGAGAAATPGAAGSGATAEKEPVLRDGQELKQPEPKAEPGKAKPASDSDVTDSPTTAAASPSPAVAPVEPAEPAEPTEPAEPKAPAPTEPAAAPEPEKPAEPKSADEEGESDKPVAEPTQKPAAQPQQKTVAEPVAEPQQPQKAPEAAPATETTTATPAVTQEQAREDIAPVEGRLGKLRGSLSKSQNVIGRGVLGILSAGDLDEDAWEEIEDTLLMADLGTKTTLAVVEDLRERIAVNGVSSEAEARAMLRSALIDACKPDMDRSIKAMPYDGKPAVIMMVGVNGTGKTTTTGKLSRVLIGMGHKVLLGAADTFRAAAADQLETWGRRVGAETVRGAEGADPASVAFDAVAKGIEKNVDVVLIDTAGRLHTSVGLMDQLGKVRRVVEKKAKVDEVLLVLDATVGQNGLIQARTFREVVDITGVVLTKLDGTAKGGIVFQVQEELGVPVKLVGLGEGADHLAPFEVESFVDALLG